MPSLPLVIFGNGNFASLAWYCVTHDSPWQVAAFTVDRPFVGAGRHQDLPVVAFDELQSLYPPGEVNLLIPLNYQRINGLRMDRYRQAKAAGYGFVSYVSSRASVWPDLQIGENCLIYEHAIIQPFARIGDNVIIRSGVHISHHCEVGSHSFIGAEAAFGGNVTLGERVFVGVGAVLRDGLQLAERSFIGAGAVLLSNTEPNAVYVGNPARKSGRTALEVSGG